VELRLLGSGGFAPSDRRETACALLRKDGAALLVDAGTGTRRLLAARALLDGAERLDVVLTHFHLDHIVGLFYLADIDLPFSVWGAGEALEGVSSRELVERLLSAPFAPPRFVEDFQDVRELAPDDATEVGSFRVLTRVQPLHSNPTLALRIDDALVWCTDTSRDPANVDFARGARLLCHESFAAEARSHHTAARDAAEVAAAAGVERLVLIHVDPLLPDEQELLAAARAVFPETVLGEDGLVVEV
jgi:ribonuclease BN (tRNA processing enzyme)